MFLYGEGGTGKSVILEALKSMIGLNNVSFVSLRHFADSMRLASLQNKLINICSEVSGKAEDYEETFKKVVSMEEIDVSPKYITPFSFSPFCKLIFAVNNWPHIADKSSAFFRRMLILGVNNVFSEAEQDKDLKDKLQLERAGILNWAISGLQRIRKQKGFYVTEEMKEEIEDIKLENNPIAHWAKENIDIKKGAYITKPDAYQKYALWANTNGHRPITTIRFAIEFFRLYRHTTKKHSRQASGERINFWPNLAWKKDGIPAEVNEQMTWEE